MKTTLEALRNGSRIPIGTWLIYLHDSGQLYVGHRGNGAFAYHKNSLRGLSKLFSYMDKITSQQNT